MLCSDDRDFTEKNLLRRARPVGEYDIYGLIYSAEQYVEELGHYHLDEKHMPMESWCQKFGKFLKMIASDETIKTFDQFTATLGSGSDSNDLAEAVARKLAERMNRELHVASKLYSDDALSHFKPEDASMHQLTEFNKKAVGLKDAFLANGANNARHFSCTLTHGWFGFIGMKLSDKLEHYVNGDSTPRGEETKAESQADTAAWSVYKLIQRKMDKIKGGDEEKWQSIRSEISDMWLNKFCR